MSLVRIPLIGSPDNRYSDSSKDQLFVNVWAESIPSGDSARTFLNKRPGCAFYQTPSGANGVARGIYSWNNSLYSVFGNTIYRDGVSIGTIGTSTGKVGFVGTTGAVAQLMIVDGTNGYYIGLGGSLNTISSPNFPTPHVPNPVYMDGYVFLVRTSDNTICNSSLEDPTTWSALAYIQAEMYPDPLINITRQSNQLVAFGSKTLEFFYDAGNINGSPLLRTDQLIQQFGLYARDSVDLAEGLICWLAQSEAGQKTVLVMEGFQPKKISTSAIERLIEADSSASAAIGNLLRTGGELFYILRTTNNTLVYNFGSQLWTQWTTGSRTTFWGTYAVDHNGVVYWLNDTDQTIYKFDNGTYLDGSNTIPITIRTNKIDMGNNNRSYCARIDLIGNQNITSSLVTISVSDDDYVTWKMARTVDLSLPRRILYRNGTFRRRAFLIQHSDNAPFRQEALELDLDQGTM